MKKEKCGAKTRAGGLCKRKALKNGRCPNHGGLSTGPKTKIGKQKSLLNLKQFCVTGDFSDKYPCACERIMGFGVN